MLVLHAMGTKLSTYAEFSDPETAARAVRALKAAGFDDITTEDLSHPMGSASDAGNPPFKKSMRFSLIGLLIGAICGATLGFLIFGLPVWVFDVPYGAVIAFVGLILCIGVGGVIGFEEGFVLAGRVTRDPTSVVDGHPVGVRVESDDGGARLVRAREILSLYSQDISSREKRWWQLRRWAHSLGT